MGPSSCSIAAVRDTPHWHRSTSASRVRRRTERRLKRGCLADPNRSLTVRQNVNFRGQFELGPTLNATVRTNANFDRRANAMPSPRARPLNRPFLDFLDPGVPANCSFFGRRPASQGSRHAEGPGAQPLKPLGKQRANPCALPPRASGREGYRDEMSDPWGRLAQHAVHAVAAQRPPVRVGSRHEADTWPFAPHGRFEVLIRDFLAGEQAG